METLIAWLLTILQMLGCLLLICAVASGLTCLFCFCFGIAFHWYYALPLMLVFIVTAVLSVADGEGKK